MDDKTEKKPLPIFIRQVSDKPATVTIIGKGIIKSVKSAGEIHLVLKDRKGNLKEDRITNSIKKGGL